MIELPDPEEAHAQKREQLRTDLFAVSSVFCLATRRERYMMVGRWHNYAGTLELPSAPISYLDKWFGALADVDDAVSALIRLRKPPYPAFEMLTTEALNKITAHCHIKTIGAFVDLKLELDEISKALQETKDGQNFRGSFLEGWSLRPRLRFLMDFSREDLPDTLEALYASIQPIVNFAPQKTSEQRAAFLRLQSDLNGVVAKCREVALDSKKSRLHAIDFLTDRPKRLNQVRRDEYEWMRQPQKVCDRWLQVSRALFKQYKSLHATCCILYLDDFAHDEGNQNKRWPHTTRHPHLPTDLIAQVNNLIRDIRASGFAAAYFKKLDWNPHLGMFYTLILLHPREYYDFGEPSNFDFVKKYWTRNPGARITSHLPSSEKIGPNHPSFQIDSNNKSEVDKFEQALIYLTLSAQQVQFRHTDELEQFRCEQFRSNSSRSVSTKGLLNEIRMERGGLGQMDPLDPRNRGPFVTAILMMIDRWLNKFIRTNGKPLFEICHANGIQTFKASGLGQQLITVFGAIPLLVGNTVNAKPSLVDWYPLRHSELQQEPKTQLFLTLYHLLDARGQTDQTGWYQIHPEVSVPLLNDWLRGLRKILQLRFKAKIDYWNEAAHRTHRNLHRVMVNEFFKEHLNCLILQFDLAQLSLGPVVLPSELTKDHRRFGDTLQHWVKRLEAQRLPTARIAVRIDVDPQTQELIGRGLLLMNSKANWLEIHALVSGEWEQAEKSVFKEPAAPRQSKPTTFTLPDRLTPPSAPRFKNIFYTSNSHILDSAAQIRRRVAMLGLIPQIERFSIEHFGWSMFVWNFDENGRSRIIMYAG